MEKRIFIAVLLLFFVAFGFAQENGCRSVVITPVNPVIQPGDSVTLNATGATFFQWSPATGLSTTIGPTTVASPIVTTTYTCTGFEPGPERVTNGNFEQGNTGFTSSYQYNSDLYGEGTYYVDSDASWHHESFTGHGHGGSGNFMIINGATMPGTNVWTETVSVQQNTNYAFSTYVCSVCAGAEAQLQFSINGQQIGRVFSAPATTNIWIQFYQIWNSGNSTSATITILNQNTTVGGNDFGLDDISFCELVYDSEAHCTVTVDAMSAGDDNVSTCFGNPVEIDFLDNDHILQNCNNLSCSIIQQPANGLATYVDNVMQYTPNEGFAGSDSFRYRITCNGQSAEAMVNVAVTGQLTKEETYEACGEFFWHGNLYTETDDYSVIVPGAGAYGCDSLYILHLTIYESVWSDTTAFVCETFNWHGAEYSESGDYDDVIITPHGCDSIVTLHLTVGSVSEFFETQKACNFYDWEVEGEIHHYEQSDHDIPIIIEGQGDECDRIYHLDLTVYHDAKITIDTASCNELKSPWCDSIYMRSGRYSHHFEGPHGCDSLVVLNLTLDYSPQLTEIMPTSGIGSHWVIPATEFQVLEYGFRVADIQEGLEYESIIWELNPPIWDLRVSDDNWSCDLTVFGYYPDTVWLSAKAYSACAPDGIESRYWLLCSFYDVDELDASQVQLYPNPAHGQFTVEADGIRQVAVYNMFGQICQKYSNLSTDKLILGTETMAPALYYVEIISERYRCVRKLEITR